MSVIFITENIVCDLKLAQDLESDYIVVIYPNAGYRGSGRDYLSVVTDNIERTSYKQVCYRFIQNDEFDFIIYKRESISINIVTMWYNEEFFAPFFLSHYDYVDKIHVFIDSDTNDRTREICQNTDNVVMHYIKFKDGLDDEYRFKVINDFLSTLTSDWVYVLDADEFIFPKDFADPRVVLSNQTGNVMHADMYHVYKHHTEKDLDINNKPVILQRRHGSHKSITNGLHSVVNTWYRKPCIVKPEIKLRYWHNGVHGFEPNTLVKLCDVDFSGAHWNLADMNNAIDRRINHMKSRQSQRNIELGQDIYKNEDADFICKVCNDMLNEPKVF